jgi:serine protease Do
VLKTSSVRAVDIADSDKLLLGASVVAVGNPKSDGISASSGIVSVPSEYITMTAADDQTTVEFRVIRVDAAVNSGNSGGGLYNLKGELVGIVNAKMVDSNVENIGYAIPSNIAINVAKNILANCDGEEHTMMQRCLLGVTLSQTSVTTEYDPETFAVQIKSQIVVSSVTEGGIAHGKLQVNDVVVAATLNGERKEIFAMHTAIDQLLAAKVGDTVTLEIIRNGETLTYSFTFTTATEVA